jgi:succinate dehydrogenase / fumarate reductase cytochrome b subunit
MLLKALCLYLKIKKARPVQYAMVDGKANSHWTSRSMGLLGTIILVFIVVHMSNFWAEYKFGHVPYARYSEDIQTGEMLEVAEMPAGFTMAHKMEEIVEGRVRTVIVKDLYKEVSVEFKEEWVVGSTICFINGCSIIPLSAWF